MRKEVKRTRVEIIGKMVKQVAALKKKKVQESEVKEIKERAAEIQKEIQSLRRLKPDQVTMTALQENPEHEKVLQDPQASPLDRAIARIITHSRFINKLQKVKEAIEEERAKAAKAELKNTDRLNVAESKNEDEEPKEKDEKPEEKDDEPEEEDEEKDEESEDDDNDDSKEEDDEVVEEKLESFSTEIHKSCVVEPSESKDPDAFELPPSKIITTSSEKSKMDEDKLKNVEAMVPNVQRSPEKSSTVSSTKSTPLKNVGKAVEEKLKSFPTEIHKSGVVEPTESKDPEAFDLPPSKIITTFSENTRGVKVKLQNAEASAPNTQSSPEKSSTLSSTKSTPPKNVGKADKEMEIPSKTQKKQDLPETKKLEADEESDLSDDEEEKEEKQYFDDSTEERFHKQSSMSEDSDDDDFFLGKVSKFKKKKSNQKSDKKATSKPQETTLGKLQSVFCSALSKSTVSTQKAQYGSRNDGSRPSRFQSQSKGPESRMKASQYKGQDVGTDRRMGSFKPNRQTFKVAGQRQAGPSGAGRGRSQFEQYQNQNPRGPPRNMSNPPQQSLHPSWEASRKRKEQQAKITAFQGKKIRFDDDD